MELLESQVKTMIKRNLKVYEAPVESSRSIPLIRPQGKWLEKLGFETGDMITVREEEGKLIIEHRDEDILEG